MLWGNEVRLRNGLLNVRLRFFLSLFFIGLAGMAFGVFVKPSLIKSPEIAVATVAIWALIIFGVISSIFPRRIRITIDTLRVRYTLFQKRIRISGIIRVVFSSLADQPGRFLHGSSEGMWLVIVYRSKAGAETRAFAAVDMSVFYALKRAIPDDLWVDRNRL